MSQSQDLSGAVYLTLKKQQPLSLQELAALVNATPEAVRLALADLGADGIRVWADSQGKLSISTKTFPDFTAPAAVMAAETAPQQTAPESASETTAESTAAPTGTGQDSTAGTMPAASAQDDTATSSAAAPDTMTRTDTLTADGASAAGSASTAASTAITMPKKDAMAGSGNAADSAPADSTPFDFPSSQERGELPPDLPTSLPADAESTGVADAAPAEHTGADSAAADGQAADSTPALAGETLPSNGAGEGDDAGSKNGNEASDASKSDSGDAANEQPAAAPNQSETAAALAAMGEHTPDLEALRAQKAQQEAEEKPMTLMGHLNELRWRLFRCVIAAVLGFVACYSVADILFGQLLRPLTAALPANSKLIYTALPEAFFTQMQVAFVAGLFLVSPYVFYQIWSFIAPGLYDEEKRFAIPVALTSALFFIGGACFCYFVVFPFAFVFFMGFATDTIQPMPSLAEYLSFALKLLFAFGLIFEMPLFTFFLSRMGVVTAGMMRSVRRYAVLGIFIVAAILTPPDVMSQMLMAGPMLLLYEMSILIAVMFGRKPKPKQDPAAAEEQG